MNNPEYVKIGDKKYKLNTSFKVALECNKIAIDDNIGDFERALAIIYKLYGDEGLDNQQDYEKLLELGQKYLLLGKEIEDSTKEPDMDFIQDMDYIEASFMSDYQIDLSNSDMHWWKFMNLINGLSNSEIGNCCILNKIRNARTFDASKIQDSKERSEFVKFQQSIALNKKEQKLTKEQEQSNEEFNKIIELWKE